MNLKRMIWLIIMGLFVFMIGLATVGQTAAQTQGTENLLVNPGFESGHHHQDGISEITVPDGWRLHWLDNVPFLGSNGATARPESVVWYIKDAPVNEQTLFFRDGSFALKVFKGGRPMYSALSHDVTGLEVGRRYRLVAPIYIDIVEAYNGTTKVAPSNLESGLVRLGASPAGAAWLDVAAINYSGYWTAATISPFYLSYPIFVFDFTATQENMTVWIEFGSRDPYANNGFFLDTIGLYTLDAVDPSVSNPAPVAPTAGPSPTPFPTPTPRPDGAIVHIVQTGDTFWSIAIRYASALGMTPEEALPVIRELNNNPTFLNVGQEIIIALPSETAPVTTAVESPEPAGGGGGGGSEAEPTEEAPAVEPTATLEPIAEATAEPEPVIATTNSICVSAFDDENGDGTPGATEGLLADAVFTISRSSGTVATYVSDGLNEPYCFEELESDSYQIAFSQPGGYKLTTAGNWAIAVSGGSVVPVQFGAQVEPVEIAAVQPETLAEPVSSESATADQGDADSGGLASNIGTIVIVAAIGLVVLAGIGIVLLRRS